MVRNKIGFGIDLQFYFTFIEVQPYKVSFYDVYTMKKPDFLPRFVQYKIPFHKRSNQRAFRISLDGFALHQL